MDTYNINDNNADDEEDDGFDRFDRNIQNAVASVRVYQPIPYGPSKAPSHHSMGLQTTFIGGARSMNISKNSCGKSASSSASACSVVPTKTCAICQDELYPLVHYYNSIQEYTIQVLACNRLSCYQTLFPIVPEDQPSSGRSSETTSALGISDNSITSRNGLHYGGNGVVDARRIPIHHPHHDISTTNTNTTNTSATNNIPTTTTSLAAATTSLSGMGTSASNEWTNANEDTVNTHNTGDDDVSVNNDDVDMDFDELESQLAAIEARGVIKTKTTSSIKISNPKSKQNHCSTTTQLDGFPCYLLHGLQEPPMIQKFSNQIHDMDDVGLSGNSASKNDQNKIQQMLQQYMEEMEDDVDILNLLQQQSPSHGSGPNRTISSNHYHAMERDERLSVMDRAFFTYTDRLKRVPRQVLRHGVGTKPLWSMYVSN
jgi:hypothetical protein